MDNTQGNFVNGAPHIVSNEGRGDIIRNSYLISGITFVISFMAMIVAIYLTEIRSTNKPVKMLRTRMTTTIWKDMK